MSTATQRKAWNEAMRSAGAVLPASSTTSGGGISSSYGYGGGVASRASDRRRKRRDKARKSSSYGNNNGNNAREMSSSSALDEKDYRVAIHMDMLEGVTEGAHTVDNGDEDDEYDEFAELDDENGEGGSGGGRGSKSKAKKKRKRKSGAGAAGKKLSAVPKYLKPRSLASILIEEASRSDSVAKQYVDASVRRLVSGSTSTRRVDPHNNAVTTTTLTNPYPSRKFCPVTGLFGEYTEPKSGIPYATLSALEQIRERHPPWMSTGVGGSASYWEAVKSLQNNG